jgi:ABC-type Mn2+/Zn2+ transport system permease subunit
MKRFANFSKQAATREEAHARPELLLHLNPLRGAAAALLLGTFLIWHLQKRETLSTNVAIGVIFSAALAVGTLVIPSEDLIEALFGGIQSLTLAWFLLGIFSVLIIIPAAIGRQLTHTLTAFLAASSVASVLSMVIGFSINRYYPHFAIGPAIISAATCFFLLSVLGKKI